MATVHKWEKYTIVQTVAITETTGSLTSKGTFYYHSSNTSESVLSIGTDGLLKIAYNTSVSKTSANANNATDVATKVSGRWFTVDATTGVEHAYYGNGETAGSGGKLTQVAYSKIASPSTSCGALIDIVESENASAYPENGVQDGYWYVYAGYEETTGLYATIDGVQRKLTSIPAMVDGVQRELSSLFATIDGVAREVFVAVKETGFISFIIGDTSYTADEGMTWAEWCESEYNTGSDGWHVSGNFVVNSNGMFAVVYETTAVSPSDTIIANTKYYYG